jgi:2-polyprenyl-3-methyl-5-hydroxy-6-metoxy-1,4-benzoquinol methylase
VSASREQHQKTRLGVAGKVYSNPGNPGVLARIPAGAKTVLDVGCGAGDNARILAARGATVDGVTLSPEEAASAAPACRNVWLHNLEFGLPAETLRRYDVVLCSHVLEHLCVPDALLADIRRSLAPGGLLIAAVPNLLFIANRLALLLGRFAYTDSGLMDNTHYKWYTLDTLSAAVQRAGFSLIERAGDGYVPLGPLRRALPGPSRRLDACASRLMPGLFGHQLIVVAGVSP